MAELFPFKRALIAHRREAESTEVAFGASIESPRHVEALSHLAEARLDVYGLPEYLRRGAKFRYFTGPLDGLSASATVSEVVLERDCEKWVLDSLFLKTVPRRFFFHGDIIPTTEQNNYIVTSLSRKYSQFSAAF